MWRIWFVFATIATIFFLILGRLFYWQIVQGEKLSAEAAGQYFLEFTIPSIRGSILATDKKPLALSQPAFLVYAEPKRITRISEFSRSVAPILGLDEQKLMSDLSDKNRFWVPLGRKIQTDTAAKLRDLKLAGLGFEKEARRFYPEASMAGALLGFVGSDENGRDQGYFGLEGYYDRELRGQGGALRIEKDARGNPILVGEVERKDPQDGRSLVLWLDRAIERIAENRLAEGIEKYGAKSGTVTIMDPATGGILAMAAFPGYDPGNFPQYPNSLYKNPIVSSSYEPGSTFKVLVMSAALNEKLVTPSTTMNEDGPVRIGEYAIKTWNEKYRGTITMTNVLEYSSNVGMVFVARKLGTDKFVSYIKAFGVGKPTGIDLEEENSPELREDRDWGEIDLATASFGQGIAVTPIQMVRAVGAIANGGWLMEPRMVREIVDERGRAVQMKPKKVRQVISGSAASVITEMMVAAVDNGEAKWAKPAGYRIAGKTGTAQIPVAGYYDKNKTIASFVGFAPADRPRFVMLVTLQEPATSPWGSETAAPLFFAIARDLFAYWGIPPQ